MGKVVCINRLILYFCLKQQKVNVYFYMDSDGAPGA